MIVNILTRKKNKTKWKFGSRTVENPGTSWFDGLRDALSLGGVSDIIVVTFDGRVHNTMGLFPNDTVTIDGATGPLHQIVNQIEKDSISVAISRQEALDPPIDYVFGDFEYETKCLASLARDATNVLKSDLTTKSNRLLAMWCLEDVRIFAECVIDHCDELLNMTPAE